MLRHVKSLVHLALNASGYELYRLPVFENADVTAPAFDCIHYASGEKYIDGWLNVDVQKNGPANYMRVNLTARHPFPDNHFRFGFCEDFIEHLDQADSLMFLVEARRTLRPGGVLRVSFPGFEATLDEHFASVDFDGFAAGKTSAYVQHRHRHFYTRASLTTVAGHLGFAIQFVEYGESAYPELRNRETRPLQAAANIHAELVRT